MPYPSTFSIVAYDPAEPAWGVAVASKFLAVGAVVPWARAGAGAVATQSYANTRYAADGLDLMSSGRSAQETLLALQAADPDREERQVGLVDAEGNSATFTGSGCFPWAGGRSGPGYAVQGNILVGEEVVAAMERAFLDSQASLPRRLYAALLAGDQAGGDRRGRQSAAILVVKPKGGYGGFNDRWVDYRVDDHPNPVVRLGELLELRDLYFDKSPIEDQIQLAGEPLSRLQAILKDQGLYSGPPHGRYDDATRQALDAFTGRENFEERVDLEIGRLDRPVYEYLLQRFGPSS